MDNPIPTFTSHLPNLPLSTSSPLPLSNSQELPQQNSQQNSLIPPKATRFRLPDTRNSITRKNAVGQIEFYVIVGFFEGPGFVEPGEVFIKIAKEGSTLSGWADALASSISLALQHGVPWPSLLAKYRYMRFEPSGPSLNNTKQEFSSLVDGIAVTIDEAISMFRSGWVVEERTEAAS